MKRLSLQRLPLPWRTATADTGAEPGGLAPIRGVNLGNWLVLEKWMEPALFEGYRAEDEDTLATVAPKDQLAQRIRHHRDTYITERDFREIAACGMNLVRLPVPYTVFESEPPLGGACGRSWGRSARPSLCSASELSARTLP